MESEPENGGANYQDLPAKVGKNINPKDLEPWRARSRRIGDGNVKNGEKGKSCFNIDLPLGWINNQFREEAQ